MTRKERRKKRLRKYVLKYFPCFYIDKAELTRKSQKTIKASNETVAKWTELNNIIKIAENYAEDDTSAEAVNARMNADLAQTLAEVSENKYHKARDDYFETLVAFENRYPFAKDGYFTKRDVKKFIKGA